MLVGQQIGPFSIERELGSGAMGAVYRGVYTKTGQRVAIKVMLPGMGENAQAAKRFEREAAILKQFSHPNIVRLFGVGKHQGMRYYAMEYIEGESLDRTLSRRGRLAWEEVVTLGRQLCAALQHAHHQGVVHRDLKPSNLMILADGILKLTDFGIAKDLDVTQLTSANCTVGTASYMSPEQCRGERVLTPKSDLYSLGIVFYELLTGRKPFMAENVMDMFLAHVQGSFERPSRVVPEIPKWLDTLVCQLLEKDPEKRPFDADTVANALAQVLEKVEAMQSAGVDAVRGRTASRLAGETPSDDTDRAAAQTLLQGGKKKRKKKVVKEPFYRQGWFQAVGIAGLLGALALVLYLLLKPPSADTLYQRIDRLMASKDPADHKQAFDGPIREYLRRYGKRGDERAKQVEAWDNQVGVRLEEEGLEKTTQRVAAGWKLDKMDDLSRLQKAAVQASLAEAEGNMNEAARLWAEVAGDDPEKREDAYVKVLAGQHLSAIETLKDWRQRFQPYFAEIRDRGREPRIENDVERKVFEAQRYEEFGDPFEARRRWEELRTDLQHKAGQRVWFLLAASRAYTIRLPKTKDEEKFRKALLEKKLGEASRAKEAGRLRDAEVISLDLQALYGKAASQEIAEFAAKAKTLFDDIQKLRTGDKP
jgi:serine/threonine-protein kinase